VGEIMGVRMNVFGVDWSRFEPVVNQPLHEILQVVLAGNQDIAEDRPRLCLQFDEPERTYYLDRGRKIFLNRQGERKYIDPGQLDTVPDLQLSARAYMRSGSSCEFNWLLDILSASDAYGSVKAVVGGQRRWWVGVLLEAFSNWFGPESSDYRSARDLFSRLLRWYGGANSDLETMPFPVLPASDSDHWMAAWTVDETKLALIYLHVLWEETASSFTHREVLIDGERLSHWGHMGVSPKEAWKHIQTGLQVGVVDIPAGDVWAWLDGIVQGFFGIEELENPSIVSFIG
jgi:hypothetical protein